MLLNLDFSYSNNLTCIFYAIFFCFFSGIYLFLCLQKSDIHKMGASWYNIDKRRKSALNIYSWKPNPGILTFPTHNLIRFFQTILGVPIKKAATHNLKGTSQSHESGGSNDHTNFITVTNSLSWVTLQIIFIKLSVRLEYYSTGFL